MDTPDNVKERIRTSARDRFFRDGFARVLVDDIADDLGISKKTIYKHFESKEELLRQIIRHTLTEVHANIQAIIASDKGFVEKLDDLMTFLGNRYLVISPLMMADCHRYLPDLWESIQKFRRERIASNVKGLILDGIRGGYIRKDLSVDVFLAAFIAGVEAVMTPSFLSNHPVDGRQALRSFMMIFFQGILTDPARTQLSKIQQTANQ
jgi:AcrR family transcriptional regulator